MYDQKNNNNNKYINDIQNNNDNNNNNNDNDDDDDSYAAARGTTQDTCTFRCGGESEARQVREGGGGGRCREMDAWSGGETSGGKVEVKWR